MPPRDMVEQVELVAPQEALDKAVAETELISLEEGALG